MTSHLTQARELYNAYEGEELIEAVASALREVEMGAKLLIPAAQQAVKRLELAADALDDTAFGGDSHDCRVDAERLRGVIASAIKGSDHG
jgi:hypothetical protein